MDKKKIYFITGNPQKLKEFTKIIGYLENIEIDIKSIDLPEYQGESEEIARRKCLAALEIVKAPVIVEDTSLCFNALNGLPGPYIKWFCEKIKPAGLSKLLAGYEDKSAYALCIFAYGEPGKDVKLFVGRNDGVIVEPRGHANFGWTSAFQPDGFTQTYAEMDNDVKNSISHRFRAIDAMKKYLTSSQE